MRRDPVPLLQLIQTRDLPLATLIRLSAACAICVIAAVACHQKTTVEAQQILHQHNAVNSGTASPGHFDPSLPQLKAAEVTNASTTVHGKTSPGASSTRISPSNQPSPLNAASANANFLIDEPPRTGLIFKLTHGSGYPICEEYLKILRRTRPELIRPCKLPDLSGSPITEIQFIPASGERLEEIDKIIYEQPGGDRSAPWELAWPERSIDYASGYIDIATAQIDIPQDGSPDLVVRQQRPHPRCFFLPSQPALKGIGELEARIEHLPKPQLAAAAKEIGFTNYYYVINEAKLSHIDARHLVRINDKIYSIDQRNLSSLTATDDWAPDREWIRISKIGSTINRSQNTVFGDPPTCKISATLPPPEKGLEK